MLCGLANRTPEDYLLTVMNCIVMRIIISAAEPSAGGCTAWGLNAAVLSQPPLT